MVVKAGVAAAILIAAQFVSDEASAYFETGNEYLATCQRDTGTAQGVCLGKAGATVDAMQAFGYKCTASNVTQGQVKDVIVKHIVENPQDRHHPAVFLMMEAVIKAFGCKAPK